MDRGNLSRPHQRLIVVLGMHRTGTSVLTRALAALGATLGEALIASVPDDNETGFWEDRDILKINIDLLNRLESEWDSLTPIDSSQLTGPGISDLSMRAVETLREKLRAGPVCAMKDPRMARLLPFWRAIFTHMELRVSYAIACRNPISVARSLAKRNGFPPTKSHLLWLDHVASCLRYTQGENRVVVDYDSLMDAPHVQLKRMAEQLDLAYSPTATDTVAFVDSFLTERLRHTRFMPGDLAMDQSIPYPVGPLYGRLLGLAQDTPGAKEDDEETSRWNERNRAVLSYIQRLDRTEQNLLSQSDGLILGLDHAAEESARLAADIEHMRTKDAKTLSEMTTELARLQTANTQLTEEKTIQIVRLETEAAKLSATIGCMRLEHAAALSTAESELHQLQAAYRQLKEETTARHTHLEAMLTERDATIDHIQQEHAEHMMSERMRAYAQLAAQENTISSLQHKVDDQDVAIRHLTAEVARRDFIVSEIHASTCWRLTKPFRVITEALGLNRDNRKTA